MNKTAIKNFSIDARRKLIEDAAYQAGLLGITEEGIQNPLPQSTREAEFYDIGTAEPYSITGHAIAQRQNLVAAIWDKEKGSDYTSAYKYMLEEVAYTWFNRLIALRFMEVNDYLPSHLRVLSSASGKLESDLVASPFEAGLSFTPDEEKRVLELKQANRLDELFRMLFIKECNALNEVLPRLFERTNDYTELLLNLSLIDEDGVVYRLVHEIPEDDFNIEKGGQVEIIGWLYQYYNTEPKAAVFARLSGTKIRKEDIPAATQLFTPDWIVRYMVENSLGRMWLDGHPNENLKAEWKYYLDETEQELHVQAQLDAIRAECTKLRPEDIKCIDPCMGSGHILVYLFDVLMQIYTSQGYSQRDAAQSIVRHNLYGLDIDKRAAQLAYFSVMMKAHQYDRRFLTRDIQPMVYSTTGDEEGENFGSLVKVYDAGDKPEEAPDTLLDMAPYEDKLNSWHYRNLLAKKYDVVVTNPPYMGSSGMNGKLSNYIKKNYPDSKADSYATFIEKCAELTRPHRYFGMITQQGWMFQTGFERLRKKLKTDTLTTMAHLGPRAFEEIGGEVVQTTSFVFQKGNIERYSGSYIRLIDATSQQKKEEQYLSGRGRFTAKQADFTKIPGSPIAYWLSDAMIEAFDNVSLSKYADLRNGMTTSDNDRFLRFWYEPNIYRIKFDSADACSAESSGCRWFPYNKGGTYSKWYGNNEYVVNWEHNGIEIRSCRTLNGSLAASPRNMTYYFAEGITWSTLSSGPFSARFFGQGFIFDAKGSCCFAGESKQSSFFLALLNSSVANRFLQILTPTLDYNPGYIAKLPVILSSDHNDQISALVQENIVMAKTDWDAFETSWDFERHPLVRNAPSLRDAYTEWEQECETRFNTLKANEEELNRIFINIYGLQDELTPDVEEKYVSVSKADLGRDVKSLLSYAVGCMFGRYSLDTDGLSYAGGEWDTSRYKSFVPDTDNIIPITDEVYFDDDIVSRFVEWLKAVYGEESLEENLNFIAEALGTKGDTSRDRIRAYFLKGFYDDHLKIYKKRPIYWQFSSGKQKGFKALMYLHRYNEDTIGKARVDYLHQLQKIYGNEIERMDYIAETSGSTHERSVAMKRKEKLLRQLKEVRDYDERLSHLALSRPQIDLDDGVKVNYRKIQTAADGKFYEILSDSKKIIGKK